MKSIINWNKNDKNIKNLNGLKPSHITLNPNLFKKNHIIPQWR